MRRTGSDDGVSLILALVFVLVVGLLIAAMLPYTGSGLKTAATVRDVRNVQNAVDGAVDQAINAIRGSSSDGLPGRPCPTYIAPDYPNPAPGTGVTKVKVECTGTGDGSPAADNQPPFALQTLAGGIAVRGNAALQVAGPVFSHGPISVDGPRQTINVDGDVYATGNCDPGSVVATGTVHCANTTQVFRTPPDPTGADPFVPPSPLAVPDPLTAVPAPADPPGTCAAGNPSSVVTFSPGYYSQLPQPDPALCPGNRHSVWWFRPGTYYFDFPDGRFSGFQYPYGNGDSGWDGPAAQNVTIIGGTPNGWDPATASSADVVAAYFTSDVDHPRTACDPSAPDGVTFVFGGPTHLAVGAGGTSPARVELCPAPAGTQQVSLFGLRSGTARSAPSRDAAPTSVTAPAAPSATSPTDRFTPAPDARDIDGRYAVADLTAAPTGQDSASVTLEGVTSGVPDGSTLLAARLRVRYYESSTLGATVAGKVQPSLTYRSDGLAPTTVTLPKSVDTPTDDVIPLTLSAAPKWRALRDALKNLRLTFTADGTQLRPATGSAQPAETASAHLDGVRLEVTYVAPALEPTTCPAGVARCTLLQNTVEGSVFLHGTVYTPRSDLELAVRGYRTSVFERGVISAGLVVHVSASTTQALPPFQLPNKDTSRVVLFTASALEPDGVTWKPRLYARVKYVDSIPRPGGTATARPGADVRVLEWTVAR